MCGERDLVPPFHVGLNSPVSSIVSGCLPDDASSGDLLAFTLPTFALPWVRGWLPLPLGVLSQLHTPPLPATHVGPATGLHTSLYFLLMD